MESISSFPDVVNVVYPAGAPGVASGPGNQGTSALQFYHQSGTPAVQLANPRGQHHNSSSTGTIV